MKTLSFRVCLALSLLSGCKKEKINRQELVKRHNFTITQNDPKKPMQVGNGDFAFSVDITGMQTFERHNTMAHWAFHNMPLAEGLNPANFKGKTYEVNSRPVEFAIDNPQQQVLSKWLAANPHPVNLGRIGLLLSHKDGRPAKLEELSQTSQHLDMWTGVITSSFVFDAESVTVKTACHQENDALGIEVDSRLVRLNQLKIFVEFPYADDREFPNFVGDFDSHEKHSTVIKPQQQSLQVQRAMDDFSYAVQIRGGRPVQYHQDNSPPNPHRLVLDVPENKSRFVFSFAKVFDAEPQKNIPDVFEASAKGWEKYWHSGAAIDLSHCTDNRAFELERRIVISQYLMKVNNSGSLPPGESGLMKNNWYGKFHLEMLWWHGVHFALWDRWAELDQMLGVYRKFLPTSIKRAQKQGYQGARWPKVTGNIDRDWPFVIHAFLIWQQPHPIYFAELDYRSHPNRQTLEKWQDVVFATADFLASYPTFEAATGVYNLSPPVFMASENADPHVTKNPAFELSYWKYGLRTAIEWRKRLGMGESTTWNRVYEKLAPLPVEDQKYTSYEGITNMWTKYNFEHPVLVGTYGMLPGDGVDTSVLRNTFNEVLKTWDFDRTWGWDYPLLAMTAARLNMPETAIDMLMFDNKHNVYDVHGYNSWVYLPGNGGLLTAVAMMAGGWDGGPCAFAPGFPKNGKWNVKVEGFNKMQ